MRVGVKGVGSISLMVRFSHILQYVMILFSFILSFMLISFVAGGGEKMKELWKTSDTGC